MGRPSKALKEAPAEPETVEKPEKPEKINLYDGGALKHKLDSTASDVSTVALLHEHLVLTHPNKEHAIAKGTGSKQHARRSCQVPYFTD